MSRNVGESASVDVLVVGLGAFLSVLRSAGAVLGVYECMLVEVFLSKKTQGVISGMSAPSQLAEVHSWGACTGQCGVDASAFSYERNTGANARR